MNMLTRLAIAALLSALPFTFGPAQAAAISELAAAQVLTGRVIEVLPQNMLMVQSGERRVLVYGDATIAQLGLRTGQAVRINGDVPSDWLRLSADELKARRVEVLN